MTGQENRYRTPSGNDDRPGDLFFHPATPEGEGGIAVVELYGEGAGSALTRLFLPRGGRIPRDGEVRLGVFEDAAGNRIDEVLVASVPPPASWCGVGCWAVSSHGGALVQRRIRAALESAGGVERDRAGIVQYARSLGALGGLEGDALCLLPGARTERAAAYLLRMARGELSGRIRGVLRLLDDRDLEGARGELQAMLAASPAAMNLLSPRRILIAGRPNSGKSYLFNRLVERERAAVTPVAGTTRDLLEETAALAGYPVVFIDSSGLRGEASDPVEEEGIRRARAADFDSLLFLIERDGPTESDEEEFMAAVSADQLLLVRTKADLHPGIESPGAAGMQGREAGWISAKAGTGLSELRQRMVRDWLGPLDGDDLPPAPFTEGQAEAIRKASSASSIDEMRLVLVQYVFRFE